MLIFRMKRIWWDKIISGEKTHEYRIANKYWESRLFNENKKIYKTPCLFTLGYPSANDKSRIRHGKIKQVEKLITGLGTDLNVLEPVFDITFELEK